jgi:hypothetical protein
MRYVVSWTVVRPLEDGKTDHISSDDDRWFQIEVEGLKRKRISPREPPFGYTARPKV